MVLFQKLSLFQLLEGLAQLLLCVHHDGAVPCHRLLQRFSRDQQKADAVIAGLHRDFVTTVEEVVRIRTGEIGEAAV